MKVIDPGYTIESIDGVAMLRRIEEAGRTCYKSEDRITDKTAPAFITSIIKRGHESVLEHEKVSVRIICDRGVSHEIVRHRIASYSQESTRYCNYGKAGEVTFIKPCFWDEDSEEYKLWLSAMEVAEKTYLLFISKGVSPQDARSVLPNSLKTEIVMTCNLREWRHFFRLRTAAAAHPQMRQIAVPMLRGFQLQIPVVFDDITPCEG